MVCSVIKVYDWGIGRPCVIPLFNINCHDIIFGCLNEGTDIMITQWDIKSIWAISTSQNEACHFMTWNAINCIANIKSMNIWRKHNTESYNSTWKLFIVGKAVLLGLLWWLCSLKALSHLKIVAWQLHTLKQKCHHFDDIFTIHGRPSEAGDCSHPPPKIATAENPTSSKATFDNVIRSGSLRFLAC